MNGRQSFIKGKIGLLAKCVAGQRHPDRQQQKGLGWVGLDLGWGRERISSFLHFDEEHEQSGDDEDGEEGREDDPA